MISNIGHLLLITALIAYFLAIITKNKTQSVVFYVGATNTIMSFLLLVYSFIISDMSVQNVFLNSSSSLPFIYKIAASWSSHEGSILFWCCLLSFVGCIYTLAIKCSNNTRFFIIIVLSFIQILFISFVLFTSNPFIAFSFAPNEGLGLNPMLQDIALSIHPPILYLGNVCYVALFAGALAVLYKPAEAKNILSLSRQFLTFALCMLTLGIGLGSWWAYRELGWGGYWFFDPVENISLLPWLSGIMLHHFLMIYDRSGKFLRWIVFLSIISFLLILYGTFIVRSGIISSVHSFAFSPERGRYIFAICGVLTVFAFAYFLLRYKLLKTPDTNNKHNITELNILLGNMFWLFALLALVIALIYPLYCYFFLGIDVSIDPDYFYKIFIPIFIPIILLAAITPCLNTQWWLRMGMKFIISAGVVIIGNTYLSVNLGLIAILLCIMSLFLIVQMLDYLITESSYFTKTISHNKIALFLGHIGFGILALSITLNCYLSREIEFVGTIGDSVYNQDLRVTLDHVKFADNINYFRQIAVFRIEDTHNNIVVLQPENRLYKIENSLSQEVDIFSFIFHDIYAVLSRVDNNVIHAKIYYHPLIGFIWFAVVIISAGFLVSLACGKRSI